jgi:serine/threonine protein kinase
MDRQGHGKSVDWWTIGCLTYEIFFGKPCFQNKDKKILEDMIRTSQFQFKNKDSSENLQNFITSLLTVNVKSRLGFGGEEEVKSHAWFSRVNFDKVMNKAYRPPFTPKLKD